MLISRFYGPGSLHVQGHSNTVAGAFRVENCSARISASNFEIRGTTDDAAISVLCAADVMLSHMTVDGSLISPAVAYLEGVLCAESFLYLYDADIQHAAVAIMAKVGGEISVVDCSGAGNGKGMEVYRGGIIILSGTTPDLMGGNTNAKSSGIIVKADGTLL